MLFLWLSSKVLLGSPLHFISLNIDYLNFIINYINLTIDIIDFTVYILAIKYLWMVKR